MNETRQLSELKAWDKNPRTITEEAFERLKWQITNLNNGKPYKPLLINQDNIVLGGNMRLRAYQELNIDPVEVSIVQTANESDMWQYALSDNDHAGVTDIDLIINAMPQLDIDWSKYAIDVQEPENLQGLIDGLKETEEDEPPAVDLENPATSQLGEVYQLGRHRLMCGDATKIEDVEKLINGQKADMVFTDPPYGVDRGGGFGGFGGFGEPIARRSYDNNEWDKDRIAKEAFDNMFTFSEKLIIFGGNFYTDYLPVSGHWIVWDKKQTMPTFGDCELAWTNSNRKSIKKYEVEYNGLLGKEPERHHPTQKPLKLCVPILNDYSEENNAILDLFGGSGSTLIACEQTNRTCYMSELDPKYCDVIRKRYAKFIGKEESWQTETPAI